MSSAMDQISYADLYARWEKGHWRATAIDFTADREQWHGTFSELERNAALWNYSMFFHGEDAVTDDLAPFIDAAPLEEQKYFLATQQVDEARHSVFFHRFMHEVVERGDGTIAEALRATEPELTWGFRKTFEMLDEITGVLRRDRSRTALARAVTMYHFIVEATLAQPGQHYIQDYLTKRELLPGFREGMVNVAQDEQRHIGFGVKLLHDLAREDPDEVPAAVADLLREVFPVSIAVFVPPNWDRRYTECFGFTLEEIYTEGARSFESKLRMAGLPLESARPAGLPVRPAGRGAGGARAGDAARGLPGRQERRRGARPAVDGAAVRQRAPGGRPAQRAGGTDDAAVGVPGRRALAPAPGQRLHRRGRGARARPGRRAADRLRRLGRRHRRAAGPEEGRRHPAPAPEGVTADAVARPRRVRHVAVANASC